MDLKHFIQKKTKFFCIYVIGFFAQKLSFQNVLHLNM